MPTTETDAASGRPFRRFPWPQLVFCIACLSMAAWTWMRYSYAWSVVPEDFWSTTADGATVSDACHETEPLPNGQLAHRYVCLRGRFEELNIPLGAVVGQQGADRLALVGFGLGAPRPAEGSGVELNGRVTARRGDGLLILDTTASRLHGASIAGLVVGAMGCFIFGLYLRGWLRETRTAFTTETQTPCCYKP